MPCYAYVLLAVLIVVWVLGALVLLKLEGALSHAPTDYKMLPIALIVWVLVAFWMLREQHDCDGEKKR
jgi:hypothetical protein